MHTDLSCLLKLRREIEGENFTHVLFSNTICRSDLFVSFVLFFKDEFGTGMFLKLPGNFNDKFSF